MYAVLKAIHYAALLLFIGGPFFWLLAYRSSFTQRGDATIVSFAKRIRVGVIIGTVLFVISGLAEGVRAASQVIDAANVSELWLFLSAARYGQMSLVKAVLAPLFTAVFLASYQKSAKLGGLLTGLLGLAVLCTISLTSHAAARPDLLPLLSDVVHLIAAVTWGGGLLYFAVLPWPLIRAQMPESLRPMTRLFERFSALAMIATLMIAITGAIATYLHVYGPEALTITPYGRTLFGKMAMFAAAIGLAAVHLLMVGPALKRLVRRFVEDQAAVWIQRLKVIVQVEAGLITTGMILAGILTTFNPAERPGHIVQNEWQRQVGDRRLHLVMSPTNAVGGVQFELKLNSQAGVPEPPGTQVSLYMRMIDHDMGLSDLSAVPITAGHYRASGLVTMAGDWQVDVRIRPPLSPAVNTTVAFEAPTGALELGRVRRVDFAAIPFSLINTLTVVMGVLIIGLALFTIWASKVGRVPYWGTLVGVSLMVCGCGLFLSAILIDAYPTSLLRNPTPADAAVVKRGEALFQTHCTTCHGEQGRGDGPAAAALNPKPADLTAEHVDDHTDGDIFWWLNYGIAGTAMPSFEQTLSDLNRWELIRYIRSLRLGVSGETSSSGAK